MTGRRPPSYTAKLEALLADYAVDNARLRQRDAEQCKRIAELEHPPPVPKLVLKKAAFVFGLTKKHELENIRRAIRDERVKAKKIGGQYFVEMPSLTDFMRSLGFAPIQDHPQP